MPPSLLGRTTGARASCKVERVPCKALIVRILGGDKDDHSGSVSCTASVFLTFASLTNREHAQGRVQRLWIRVSAKNHRQNRAIWTDGAKPWGTAASGP